MEAEKKLGEEPAFPYPQCGCFGISKRYYTACIAMQGILASYAGMSVATFPKEWIAIESFKMADELLKQEDENK